MLGEVMDMEYREDEKAIGEVVWILLKGRLRAKEQCEKLVTC